MCPAFHRQVQLGCRRGVAEVHLNSLSCAAVVDVVVVVVVVVAASEVHV